MCAHVGDRLARQALRRLIGSRQIHTLFDRLKGTIMAIKSTKNERITENIVREKLREGEEVPLDLFGVHRQRVSKIEV